MSEHTPGPWHVYDDTTVYGPGNPPPDEYVAECPYGYSPEASLDNVNKATAVANARLISAAPDGEAFANEFLDWAENFEAAWEWAAGGESTGEALVHDPGWQGLKALAEAFIAKAQGETR